MRIEHTFIQKYSTLHWSNVNITSQTLNYKGIHQWPSALPLFIMAYAVGHTRYLRVISGFTSFWYTASTSFYPRDAMLVRVIEIATCLSVCLSVHLSVTRRYCVKTKKVSGMISSPSGSPKTLVFLRQISSPNSKGFPPNGGLKQGSVGKIQRFASCKCQYLENGVLISRIVTEPTLFFSFERQYLENGSRYGQSYY